MKNLLYIISFGLLTGCTKYFNAQNIEGKYTNISGYSTTMNIKRISEKQEYEIYLLGGTEKNNDQYGGISADCESKIIGKLEDKILYGKPVPINNSILEITTQEIEEKKASITINFNNEIAIVDGNYNFCGIHNNLFGKFQKITTINY